MQLVIDIPDEEYRRIVYIDIFKLRGYIENGTQLPKGHGRLIDANNLPRDIGWDDVENAPTIIEAEDNR